MYKQFAIDVSVSMVISAINALTLPDAASLSRTTALVADLEKQIAARPWAQSVLTVVGYSLLDGLALSNKALMVVGMKPFEHRSEQIGLQSLLDCWSISTSTGQTANISMAVPRTTKTAPMIA